MKRALILPLFVAVVALAATAFAGEGHECTSSTQECLDQMAAKVRQQGWVGLDGRYDDETGLYLISTIVAGSPAVAAGLQVEDTLFSFNGVKFSEMSEEQWEKTAATRVPGATVTYGFMRNGEEHEISVTLAEMPEDVIATAIGRHMMQHVTMVTN